MADFIGTARSNYFHVRNRHQFERAVADWDVEVVDDSEGRVCLLSFDEHGLWPITDDPDEEIHEVLAPHLQDGEVAVFMEVGAERLRYVGGRAVAVNHDGQTRSVCLDDIYDLAAPLGDSITEARF